MKLLALLLLGQTLKGPLTNSAALCNSKYAVPLGVLQYRHSIAVQTQYDATPIWIGGPTVTTCYGCPYSISDAGFIDGGPGALGEQVVPGGYLTKNVSPTKIPILWCIKQSGAQDGTFDGGVTAVSETP